MIPIDEKFLPGFLKKTIGRRIVLTAIVLLIIFGGFYYYLINLGDSIRRGPDYTDVDNDTAEKLFDSIAVGLEKYHRINGQYPQIKGKYFLDSIKQYLNLRESVYADSMTVHGDSIIRRGNNAQVDFMRISRTYYGIGIPKRTILYVPISFHSYRLIYVGTNGIDEGGDGDDLVYEKD